MNLFKAVLPQRKKKTARASSDVRVKQVKFQEQRQGEAEEADEPGREQETSRAHHREKERERERDDRSLSRSKVRTFQPTHEAHYTPRIDHATVIKYRKPEDRSHLTHSIAPKGSIIRPNYDDALRRVSVVIYQHINMCERRLKTRHDSLIGSAGLSPKENTGAAKETSGLAIGRALLEGEDTTHMFHEDNFVVPQFQYTFVRPPAMTVVTYYSMKRIQREYKIPSVDEIYRFCKHLFTSAQLTSECTIVCLVYVERLMEMAHVDLLSSNWRPILLCGLLLASKVWQDLSSWNVEFSNIYPQFPLSNINRLERIFLHHIRWDLYIAGSVYAKYYFALRSMTEKKDFRKRYNYMIQVDPPHAKKLEERTAAMKTQLYSTSV